MTPHTINVHMYNVYVYVCICISALDMCNVSQEAEEDEFDRFADEGWDPHYDEDRARPSGQMEVCLINWSVGRLFLLHMQCCRNARHVMAHHENVQDSRTCGCS